VENRCVFPLTRQSSKVESPGRFYLQKVFSALKKAGNKGGISTEVFGHGLKKMTPEAAVRPAWRAPSK
jgi:hypothetical protein